MIYIHYVHIYLFSSSPRTYTRVCEKISKKKASPFWRSLAKDNNQTRKCYHTFAAYQIRKDNETEF